MDIGNWPSKEEEEVSACCNGKADWETKLPKFEIDIVVIVGKKLCVFFFLLFFSVLIF